jgi:hypothetical protein
VKARLRIVVSGRLAEVPGQGGAAWAVLQYVLGLRKLGHEVWFIEPMGPAAIRPDGARLEASSNADYFRTVAEEFAIKEHATLLVNGGHEAVGMPYETVVEIADSADLLVNLSGVLVDEEIRDRIPVRLYVDLDPGFTQLWQEIQGIDMGFGGHTHYATVGTRIGSPDCSVPTCGLDWLPTLPPVVLEEWPTAGSVERVSFTTVANWRSYGSIEHEGVFYGQKAHAFREFMDLPSRSHARFEVALTIHPEERDDLCSLEAGGWHLLDPVSAAGTPDRYRSFLAGSLAELGIAKSGYAASGSGWFSDRSVCYLACGRPVIAQETGFSRQLPTGAGLLAFEAGEEAVAGVEAIRRDYGLHSRAARSLAEQHFDSDRVLNSLLERIGFGNA